MRIGRSQRFDRARPFVTLGIVLAAWIGAPLFFKSFVRASFFELAAPVAAVDSFAADVDRFWALRIHTKDELIEAGRDLARVNSSYALTAQENSELTAQVARLEGLLRMPPLPGYRFEPARVAERDFSGWWQRLVIRKGSDYAITVGSPVVYSGGIVGRVSEVHAYTSVVQMVSDPGLRIAAVVEDDTRPVSYIGGNNPSFGSARGTIEFVPLDIYASGAEPKRLVTSGLGGVYPRGLTIGRVVHVESSADGLFKTGAVELDPRLAALVEVTVLVPLPQGR